MNRRLLITSALASLLAPAFAAAQDQPQTRPAPGGGRPGGGGPGQGGGRPPGGGGGGGRPPGGGGGPPPRPNPGGGGKPPPRPNPGGRPPGDHHGGRPPLRPTPGGPTPLPGPYRPGGGRPPQFRPIRERPYRYPRGYRYRRWTTGLILPAIFLTSAYFYDDYYRLGLGGAPYGYRWVRYGPDLLLVELGTGRIVDVIYGAFY